MRKQTIAPERLSAYKNEILDLKKKYEGKIDIFLGIEYEPWTDFPAEGFDYSIGAVHYLLTRDGYRSFDVDREGTLSFIDTYFEGDSMRFAKAYYNTVAELGNHGKFDILAHLDVITKHNEKYPFLDTECKEYKTLVYEAIDALAGEIPYFELNTGAISRGYRSNPYPSAEFLKYLRKKGFGAVITSDCHNKEYLDCFFDGARELLAKAGFTSRFILTNKGFEEIAI